MSGTVFQPPYRAVGTAGGAWAVWDAVSPGPVLWMRDRMADAEMLAAAVVAGLNAAARAERAALPVGTVLTYDLPVGGDLAVALAECAASYPEDLFSVEVAHDDGCPAIGMGSGCSCEIVTLTLTRTDG